MEEIMYRTSATASGGRDGRVSSVDKTIDLILRVPHELGGDSDIGPNPEQLFAAGYAACFLSAMKHVSKIGNVQLPTDLNVKVEVGLGQVVGGFNIAVAIILSSDLGEDDKILEIAKEAHKVCPYSNATSGNIKVDIKLA